MPSPLAKPITIRGAVKSTKSNLKTGERSVSLSFPSIEANNVARLSIMDGIEFEIGFNQLGEERIVEPITITGRITGIASNSETGERSITLYFKKREALKVAQLSRYDMIAFEITFSPVDVADSDEDEL